ncbi:hypothetical protein EI42_05637 [Thermosporothrix hazakensis]|jgi:hypothetical protein|uniref:Uncharacterized protein n=1 Tax=Thermosporothrix hazakensis TaxID=644383 RepID=A0A326TVK9_THEHA|nr:hypothetical protein EI42_05637 [Thermosporothrix hazakensis]
MINIPLSLSSIDHLLRNMAGVNLAHSLVILWCSTYLHTAFPQKIHLANKHHSSRISYLVAHQIGQIVTHLIDILLHTTEQPKPCLRSIELNRPYVSFLNPVNLETVRNSISKR